MTNTLIVIDRVGPFEGAIISALEESGRSVYIFHSEERRFFNRPEIETPVWFNQEFGVASNRWWTRILAELNITEHVGAGIAATEFACQLFPDRSVVGVLRTGDVDFARRRTHLLRRLSFVSDKTQSLVFLNEWEMTKACTLGSTAPHYLWNFTGDMPDPQIPEAEGAKVAVIYGETAATGGISLEDFGLTALRHVLGSDEGKVDYLSSNSMLWYVNLKRGRRLPTMISHRLREYSHLIFVSGDSDSLVTIASLRNSPQKQYALPSVATGLVARSAEQIVIAAPGKIAALVGTDLLGIAPNEARSPQSGPAFLPGRRLLDILEHSKTHSAEPRYREDFGNPSDEYAIFLSVPPVEERSNGARPQRVRSIYLAMSQSFYTIQLTFNEYLVKRRIKLLRSLMRQGKQIKFVYGENSTTPVMDTETLLQMRELLGSVASQENSWSTWFVRDLHWLDPEVEIEGNVSTDLVIRQGITELEQIGAVFDVIVGPSRESAEMFNQLLEGRTAAKVSSGELPPATEVANQVELAKLAPIDFRPTLVYSGGFSETYRMDLFLNSLASTLAYSPEGVFADFIVREADENELIRQLEARGLANSDQIRVINGTLAEYFPRTRNLTGVLLLESAYGLGSFPFKSVSYLELGMPVLCFGDSPVHRRFGDYGVTIPVDRTQAAVDDALVRLLTQERFTGSFDDLWREENWLSRVQEAMTLSLVGVQAE